MRDRTQAKVLSLSVSFLGKPTRFLIDSGAERSIVSLELIPQSLLHPCDVMLTGVGGEPIKTFGQVSCKLGVRSLRREYSGTFIAASTRSIIGADFLTTHGLTINMKEKLLTDSLTNLSASLEPVSSNHAIHFTHSSTTHPIFQEFPNVLLAPDYSSLPATEIKHTINTKEGPTFCKPRPLAPAKLAAAKEEFNRLLQLNIVRPSNSPWASPLHMVRKSDGSWRPCGDYRRVNMLTVPDRYPLPNLQTFHYNMSGSTVFSKLDLVKAYHFVPVHPADIGKTAISTPFGSYEYLRMPFGMRNSAGTFQRFIDSQLQGLDFAMAYVDDIIIFSKTAEDHKDHIRTVLKRLSDTGLRVNHAKCKIAQPTIEFLGYEVSAQGLKPPTDRIKALCEMTTPKDAKDLVRVLGMFGFYQRCVPAFAELASPLRDLARAPKYEWKPEHEKSFTNLKKALCNSVMLTFPKAGRPLTITTDASAHSIGACLNQIEDGMSKPLAFFSRKLSATEKKYSAFDRELLALFSAAKKWKDLIDCTPTTAFTDHKPLIGAFSNTKPRLSDRQQRQLSFLSEFLSDLVHISGKDNVVADTLSRCDINAITETSTPVDLPGIAKEQAKEPESYSKFQPFNIGLNDTPLYCETSQPNPRPVIPASLRRPIFDCLHNMSHPGTKATIRLLITRYFWSNLKSDVQSWCSECTACQQSKIGRHTKNPIKSIPSPSQRFLHVHMDLVGPLDPPDSTKPDNFRYLLTVIDAHTRWLEAIPLNDITASTVCNAFLLNWVSRFGPPLQLTSDRGTQFNSELASRLNELLGIHHIRTSAYNPRANGIVERSHRTLKSALKSRGGNWLAQLPIVLFGMRMRPDEDGTSAFSRVTGEQPLVPHVLPSNLSLTQLATALHKLPFSYQPTRPKSIASHMPEKLKTCKHVWLRTDRVRRPLEAPYQGPYEVTHREEDVFKLSIRGKEVPVSISRLKPAILPAAPVEDTPHTRAKCEETKPEERRSDEEPCRTTRSGRKIAFQIDPNFHYDAL